MDHWQMNTGKQLEKLELWPSNASNISNGIMKNFKSHFCTCGDQQLEGIDFFETYAPVNQLITVFLILILENLLCLKSNKLMLLWSSYVLILEKKRNSIRGASWFQATQFKWEVEDSFSQENSLWPTSKSLCLLEIPY
ncbi:hypothetical protein ACHAXS_000802 [Conticribra weissflogii]